MGLGNIGCSRKVFMLVFLALMLPIYAGCPGLPPTGNMGCKASIINSDYPWPVYAVFGVAIAFVAVALAQMLSSAIGSSEMKAWAANEFWQAITTALIVSFLLIAGIIESLAVPAFGYSDPRAQGADISPVGAGELIPTSPVLANAYIFLRKSWCYAAGTSFVSLIGQAQFLSVLRGMELTYARPFRVVGFELNVKQAIPEFISGTFGKIFSYITDPLIGVTGIITAQMFVLCIIDYVGMVLLLPLGIILRAVPFLRGLGTALIAIAIGLFLVYPLTLMFNEKIVLAMNPDKIEGGATTDNWWRNAVPPDAVAYLGASVASSGAQVVIAMSKVVNKTLPPWFINNFRTFNLALVFMSMAGAVHMALTLVDRASFVILILGAVLPFLSIVITFGITREIAKLLGSDVNLNTLLKIL